MWAVKLLIVLIMGFGNSETTTIFIEGPVQIHVCDTDPGTPTKTVDEVRCTEEKGRVVAGQCLIFSRVLNNWSDAKDACEANGHVLAALQDLQGVVDYMNDKSNNIERKWHWTGGSDAATEGTWMWQDNSPVGDIPWYSDEKGYTDWDCLSVDHEGYYDRVCSEVQRYICEAVDI